jgi:hypothetical protein
MLILSKDMESHQQSNDDAKDEEAECDRQHDDAAIRKENARFVAAVADLTEAFNVKSKVSTCDIVLYEMIYSI